MTAGEFWKLCAAVLGLAAAMWVVGAVLSIWIENWVSEMRPWTKAVHCGNLLGGGVLVVFAVLAVGVAIFGAIDVLIFGGTMPRF